MDDMTYMLDKLHLADMMPVIITDGQFQILSCRENLIHIDRFFEDNSDLWELLCRKAKGQDLPILYLEENSFAYGVLHDEFRQRYCFLGPVLLGDVKREDFRSYRSISDYAVAFFSLSLSFSIFLDDICALYFAACHRQVEEDRLIAANRLRPADNNAEDRQLVRLQILSSEQQEAHHTYQQEQLLWEKFKEGKSLEELAAVSQNIIPGTMAKNSRKQSEYTCVTMITLLTRYSIEAGAPPAETYHLSDHYLQMLEHCNDQISIQSLSNNAFRAFTNLVQNAKSSGKTPSYIAACKNYIAAHRTKNIQIRDLSMAVGMSHSYLTKKFREHEGITIQQYIIREKIRAAANMLKFSDASISEIAEYLSFASQSHMGQYFKKIYNMTPKEYREKNRVVEFT